ncbi:MAG: histidinol-phosphatase [Micrococcales bacterium]|nr:histidinol-phosphatase [Micrococcales bacterium]
MTTLDAPLGADRWGEFARDLWLAHVLADVADEVAMARFGAADLRVESKPDMTPVTDADRAVEQAIRGKLAKARPADAILGEEFGGALGAGRTWVIDPIDGTKNFVRGVPVWATLIGLVDNGEAVLGVVSAPSLGRRWFAARGTGAWKGLSLASASALRVSGVSRLGDASFSCSSVGGWAERGRLAAYLALTKSVWRTRGYGDFWSYMLLAEGAVDLAAEPELALHDMAACAVIVAEAGGRFTDTRGEIEGPFGADALATNGLLHEEAVEVLEGGAGR